jgi:prepilin-type N-terminal cleavage/methylation domain-containing protein
MKQWAHYKSGFTIVELLIVVVVIAILASITVVAFSGVRDRTERGALLSNTSQFQKKVEAYAVENSGMYPTSLAQAGINDTGDVTVFYEADNAVSPRYFCLVAETPEQGRVFVSSKNSKPAPGSCEGLVGWWPFNGDSTDYARYGHASTNYGATPSTGQNNESGAFNFGINDGIVVPNFDYGVMRATSFSSSWTLSSWVYSSANSSNETVIVGRQGCHGGLYVYSNTYQFAVKTASCWTGAVALTGPATDTTWRLITGVYVNGQMDYYVDGVFVQSGTLPTMNGYSTTLNLGGIGTRIFYGKMDDTRVYTRALSAAEIQRLYSSGAY